MQVVHDRVPPLDATTRTRIAPAPSGDLHVGNVRTALFSWAVARRAGGRFVLRVEDTDRSRATDEAFAALQRDLAWVGLDWDEGPGVGGPHAPYRQSERSDVYVAAVDRLLAAGAAYRAFDTAEELAAAQRARAQAKLPPRYDGSRWRALGPEESAARAAAGEAYAVRFALAPGTTTWHDLVRGEVTIAHEADFPLTRTGGAPLYVLAAAVDDVAMGLTHIVRGEDLVAATPRQLALYAALGHPPERWPAFAHLPLIVGEDGKPLSKRNGEVSVAAYREAGYTPEALRNYLGQLGWSMPDGRERFDLAELTAAFSLDRVQRSPARFDVKKLEALNGEWLRSLPDAELAARVGAELAAAGVQVDLDLVAEAVPALASRVRRLPEAVGLLRPLVPGPVALGGADDDPAAVLLPDGRLPLATALDVLAPLEVWEPESAFAALRAALVDGLGLKPRVAFVPLYVALTGRRSALPLDVLLGLLGRDEVLQRLAAAVAWVDDRAPAVE